MRSHLLLVTYLKLYELIYLEVLVMGIDRHGITIGIERIGSEPVLVFKATGKLTHKDYEAIVPVLDSSLEGINSNHIKMLVDITEFTGWELRAAWDDFKLGLKVGFKNRKDSNLR